MSNDKSLIIVEAAQVPQVVAVSDVSELSLAEIEFQKANNEFKAHVEQVRKVAERGNACMERVVHAWMAENYPEVRFVTTSSTESDEVSFTYGVRANIDSPLEPLILCELHAYMFRLRHQS